MESIIEASAEEAEARGTSPDLDLNAFFQGSRHTSQPRAGPQEPASTSTATSGTALTFAASKEDAQQQEDTPTASSEGRCAGVSLTAAPWSEAFARVKQREAAAVAAAVPRDVADMPAARPQQQEALPARASSQQPAAQRCAGVSLTAAPWSDAFARVAAREQAGQAASHPWAPQVAADSGPDRRSMGSMAAPAPRRAAPLPMAPTAAPWATTGGSAGAPRSRKPPVPSAMSEAKVVDTQPQMPVQHRAAQQQQQQQQQQSGAGQAFQPARKRITSEADLQVFLRSQAAKDFVGFLLALNEAVKNKQLSDACPASPVVEALLTVLDTLWRWVEETPPAQHTLRYGNPAFRTWFARLSDAAPQVLSDVLPQHLQAAVPELVPYFVDSFGNATRIDYGTGHETTFAALLYCLARLGALEAADQQAIVARVFNKYLTLMRKVQTTYWLEPAGSHGVWGLDDYQFLPFVWGSAQLIDHQYLRPKSIHSAEVLEDLAYEYLYIGCVRFMKQVKKGPLAETSPMINDISGLPSWSKVNAGMIRMYQVEVLSKFPIMQHFLFGSLLPFEG